MDYLLPFEIRRTETTSNTMDNIISFLMVGYSSSLHRFPFITKALRQTVTQFKLNDEKYSNYFTHSIYLLLNTRYSRNQICLLVTITREKKVFYWMCCLCECWFWSGLDQHLIWETNLWKVWSSGIFWFWSQPFEKGYWYHTPCHQEPMGQWLTSWLMSISVSFFIHRCPATMLQSL